jgi:hypothetical protein
VERLAEGLVDGAVELVDTPEGDHVVAGLQRGAELLGEVAEIIPEGEMDRGGGGEPDG